MARIFLRHASEDKPQVREVYQRLKALGFDPWLDEEDILPGQNWDYEIKTAMETSEFILVFLSTRSVGKSGYIQREFKRTLDRLQEIPANQIHTIPVKLDDCEVPPGFNTYQWGRLDDASGFDRIVRALHRGFEQRGFSAPEASSSSVATPPASAAAGASGGIEDVPETFTNSVGMTFVRIAAGSFLMGTSDEEIEALIKRYPDTHLGWFEDERPQHSVTISEPFWMGTHPVTQVQWEAVMGDNPSRFKGDLSRPVEQVSWDDVQQFLERLSASDGRTYTLPSEAQWEYTCRAGSSGAYCFGDDVSQLGDYAWYQENSGHRTHPVGKKQANAWGLYDMHGNVWEWCQDFYGDYLASAAQDPSGPDAGAFRVIRGGGWDDPALLARAACRYAVGPAYRDDGLGFRCSSSGSEPSK